jgi:Predicted hydrolases or acyltransferases (alpha/beta hydrolase superfamily)
MALFFQTYGTKEPLILIPGFASGAWSWFQQIDDLSRCFRLITFDPRGIGRSRASAEDLRDLSMSVFAADVARILDELEIEKAHVLGTSFGGFVAQEFAFAFPERAEKLILACTSFGGANHVAPEKEILEAFAVTDEMNASDRIRRFMSPAFTDSFNAKHPEAVETVCRLRESFVVSQEVYTAQLKAAVTFDFEEKAAQIKHETLILTGDSDRIVPMRNSVNLAEKMPNAHLKIIKNGGHMFFIENALEFNRAVKEFLNEKRIIES